MTAPGGVFAAIFDNAAVAIAQVATDGRFLQVNRAYGELTGYSPKELAEATFQSITHPDDVAIDEGAVGALLSGERDRYVLEKRYVSKDGQTVWVTLTVTLVRDPAGAADYLVAVAERIEARKRIEAALAARESELRAMEEREALAQARRQVNSLQAQLIHTSRLSAMGTMASSLAHELNQPLAAVVSYMSGARRLLEQEAPGGRQSAIAAILAAERSAIHAGDIIRRIRSMLTRREMKKEGCALAGLIGEAAAIALVGPEARGVFYRQDVAPDLRAMADPLQIQQVLINLIRNAIDAFGARGDNIRICAILEGAMVRISVSDNGPGLHEEVRTTLFEPFLSTKPDGMGVGLSICRTIVEAHGGKIWFAPDAGAGATVCFTLPAA